MAVSDLHGLYAVGIGATTLGGITRQNLAIESEIKGEATSGEIYSRVKSLYLQKLAPTFSTRNVAAALAAIGVGGVSMALSNLVLYAQKWADGGSRTSGSNHRKFTFSKGLLIPTRLTANHRDDAELECNALVVSADGSTAPITIAESQAVPAVTDDGRHTIGPCKVGNITLTQIDGIGIDFGLDVLIEGSDSDVYDSIAVIREVRNPTITITTSDIDTLKATMIPVGGIACTQANTIVYLRKRQNQATLLATGTAEHIKFAAYGMAVVETGIDASSNDPGEARLRIECAYDGTNAPITVNTASAIT